MRLLPVVAGAIVPHAPLLLPDLQSDEIARETSDIRSAIRGIDLGDAEAIVLVSPHSRDVGVYASVQGDLSEFGIPSTIGDFKTDDALVAAISEAGGLPVLTAAVDYAVLVPALIAEWDLPIVAVGLQEGSTKTTRELTHALADGRLPRVALIGSAHGSAALSPRAPLTLRPEARDVEATFLGALQRDIAEVISLLPAMTDVGGSCGGPVFEVFASLFEGREARLLAYRAPVGVGYLVAQIT